MNFKVSPILIFVFLLSGCGVKSDPLVPQDTLLPSIESKYIGENVKEKEKKKVPSKSSKSSSSNDQ